MCGRVFPPSPLSECIETWVPGINPRTTGVGVGTMCAGDKRLGDRNNRRHPRTWSGDPAVGLLGLDVGNVWWRLFSLSLSECIETWVPGINPRTTGVGVGTGLGAFEDADDFDVR
ncbi:MAG: hypothetical protein ACJAVO_001394 [Parvibaculaceae bacterium]|jgi:hypothetical protein